MPGPVNYWIGDEDPEASLGVSLGVHCVNKRYPNGLMEFAFLWRPGMFHTLSWWKN